jgi:acyl-CoA synthetase (AMP-forming)/AMP-acid ligase II
VGKLIYEGDNVALGYSESRGDLAKGDEWRGRLATGDMAKFDIDGFYYIVGRKKRFLKLFGSRVNLDETENLINALGIECACGGVDDKLTVYITDSAKRREVENCLIYRFNINRAGFAVSVIDHIPRGEVGKIMYSALPNIDGSDK